MAAAAQALADGEPVVIPTETVYGLAADAVDAVAVARVFAAKDRPADDPLIVHVSPGLLARTGADDRLAALVALGLVSPALEAACARTALALLEGCWPGPLTVVLPRGPAVPDAVTSGLPAVALRMPEHPVALAVIDAAGRALVAPSANRFGRISPTHADAARAELDGRVRLIVDGGACRVGVESTVVRVHADGSLGLLRPGAITPEQLTGRVGSAVTRVGSEAGRAASPGRTPSHYAPRTPLVVTSTPPSAWSDARIADLRARLSHGRLGWLAGSDALRPSTTLRDALGAPDVVEALLASDGRASTAARHLYATLRSLDEAGPDVIVACVDAQDDGLAEALTDRLTRASHGTRPLPP
ncbi:MAG: L-threonylcarbamoyladenylate synthase [Alphaproteobacteria bacterium]|nr:L-threonylcarbamoyladenylate synthase [Alphaproteobacteria bacterium]